MKIYTFEESIFIEGWKPITSGDVSISPGELVSGTHSVSTVLKISIVNKQKRRIVNILSDGGYFIPGNFLKIKVEAEYDPVKLRTGGRKFEVLNNEAERKLIENVQNIILNPSNKLSRLNNRIEYHLAQMNNGYIKRVVNSVSCNVHLSKEIDFGDSQKKINILEGLRSQLKTELAAVQRRIRDIETKICDAKNSSIQDMNNQPAEVVKALKKLAEDGELFTENQFTVSGIMSHLMAEHRAGGESS